MQSSYNPIAQDVEILSFDASLIALMNLSRDVFLFKIDTSHDEVIKSLQNFEETFATLRTKLKTIPPESQGKYDDFKFSENIIDELLKIYKTILHYQSRQSSCLEFANYDCTQLEMLLALDVNALQASDKLQKQLYDALIKNIDKLLKILRQKLKKEFGYDGKSIAENRIEVGAFTLTYKALQDAMLKCKMIDKDFPAAFKVSLKNCESEATEIFAEISAVNHTVHVEKLLSAFEDEMADLRIIRVSRDAGLLNDELDDSQLKPLVTQIVVALQDLKKVNAIFRRYVDAWIFWNMHDLFGKEEYKKKFIDAMYQFLDLYSPDRKLELSSAYFHHIVFLLNKYAMLGFYSISWLEKKNIEKHSKNFYLIMREIGGTAANEQYSKQARMAAKYYALVHQYRYQSLGGEIKPLVLSDTDKMQFKRQFNLERLVNTANLTLGEINKLPNKGVLEYGMIYLCELCKMNCELLDAILHGSINHAGYISQLLKFHISELLSFFIKNYADICDRWSDYSIIPAFSESFNVFQELFSAFDFYLILSAKGITLNDLDQIKDKDFLYQFKALWGLAQHVYNQYEIISNDGAMDDTIEQYVKKIMARIDVLGKNSPQVEKSKINNKNNNNIEKSKREDPMLKSTNNFNVNFSKWKDATITARNHNEFLGFFHGMNVDAIIEIIKQIKIDEPLYQPFVSNILDLIYAVKEALRASARESMQNKSSESLTVQLKLLSSLIALEKSMVDRGFSDKNNLNETADLCHEVEAFLFEIQSTKIDVYNSYKAYFESLNQFRLAAFDLKSTKYKDGSDMIGQFRLQLKEIIVKTYGVDTLMYYFLFALIECVTLDVFDEADRQRALRTNVINFLNQYANMNNGISKLDALYDTEFLFLMNRCVSLLMGHADHLLADVRLQRFSENALSAITDVFKRTNESSFNHPVSIMLTRIYHYPYCLIHHNDYYERNELFNAYFKIKSLQQSCKLAINNKGLQKNKHVKLFQYLIEFYMLNAEYFELQVKKQSADPKNDHEYLRVRLRKFDLGKIKAELKLAEMTLEEFEEFSIIPGRLHAFNPLRELIVAIHQLSLFLTHELGVRVEGNWVAWFEKFKSFSDAVKEFNDLEIVRYVLDERHVDTQLDKLCDDIINFEHDKRSAIILNDYARFSNEMGARLSVIAKCESTTEQRIVKEIVNELYNFYSGLFASELYSRQKKSNVGIINYFSFIDSRLAINLLLNNKIIHSSPKVVSLYRSFILNIHDFIELIKIDVGRLKARFPVAFSDLENANFNGWCFSIVELLEAFSSCNMVFATYNYVEYSKLKQNIGELAGWLGELRQNFVKGNLGLQNIYQDFLDYTQALNAFRGHELTEQHHLQINVLRDELKVKIEKLHGEMNLTFYFFSMLLNCITYDVVNDPEYLRRFTHFMSDFMRYFVGEDVSVFKLDKLYFKEFIYLTSRFMMLVVKTAENLFSNKELQFIFTNLINAMVFIVDHSDGVIQQQAISLKLYLEYPRGLLDLNKKYDKVFYSAYFHPSTLQDIKSINAAEADAPSYFNLLNKLYRLRSHYYHKYITNSKSLATNNHEYLNVQLGLFSVYEWERFFESNKLSLEKYREFSVNFFEQLILVMHEHLDWLNKELKECVGNDKDKWIEKYLAILKLTKLFYQWPVTSYAIDSKQLKTHLASIENELDRLSKKSIKVIKPIKVKDKPEPVPIVKPVLDAPLVQPKPNIKKPKKLTPSQLAIKAATKELLQEEEQKREKEQEMKLLDLPNDVIEILTKLGSGAYLVGGATREGEPNDYDIVVDGLSEAEVSERLSGDCWVGKNHRVYDIPGGDTNKPIQISIMKGTMQQDADSRDFSCNARYFNWHENKFYDFHGSEEAIKNKKIKFIGEMDKRITEDPSRILRAFRLMVAGYSLEDVFQEAHIKELSKLNQDKRHYEIIKSLRTDTQNTMFKLFGDYQILQRAFSISNIESAWCLRRLDMLLRQHNDDILLGLTLMYPAIAQRERQCLQNPQSFIDDYFNNFGSLLKNFGVAPTLERRGYLAMVVMHFLMMKNNWFVFNVPLAIVNNIQLLKDEKYYLPFLFETAHSYHQEIVSQFSPHSNRVFDKKPGVKGLMGSASSRRQQGHR